MPLSAASSRVQEASDRTCPLCEPSAGYPPAYHRAAAAQQHGRPTFICWPHLVLAHVCEGVEL